MKRILLMILITITLIPAIASAGKLEDQLAALETTVAAQQAQINSLLSQLADVQANPALQLGPYVHIDEEEMVGVAGPNIVFTGVNMHLQSGSGYTNGTPNGLGNLIIGYNEAPDVLLPGDRSGSHNFIMGRAHKYTSNDSILHGWGGTVTQHAVAILAGDEDIVNRSYSAVIGGRDNVIEQRGVAIGGFSNLLNGYRTVIVGGQNNTTTGSHSTVTGGTGNIAAGDYSSVSGGAERTASEIFNWAAGSLYENN